MDQKVGVQNWILLGVLSLIWGSSFILMKRGLLAFDFIQVGSLRVLLSTLVVLPIAWFKKNEITKKNILPIFGVGLLGSGIPPFLYALALTEIGGALAGILNTLTPLFTFLIGVVIFGSLFKVQKLIGVMIGLAGALVILIIGSQLQSDGNPVYGIFAILSTVCYAFSINIIQKYLKTTNPITITAYSFVLISLPTLILFLFTNPIKTFTHQEEIVTAFSAVFILAVVGTVLANLLFFKMTQQTNALFASTVTYTIPIVALFWGLFDNELLNYAHFLGMALILIGVFITSRSK